jgi:hypothetical protein
MAGGAGPLSVGTTPEVDVPAAKELIEQIHQQVGVEELGALVHELEVKVATMRRLLAPDGFSADRVREALGWTFVGRRRGNAIIGARSDEDLKAWIAALLTEGVPVGTRLEGFCDAAGPIHPSAAVELGTELLHFTDPDRNWLWSRWVWNAESRTGALPLLIGEDFDLDADGLGEAYARIGEALKALDESPEAGAFRRGGGGRLGTDVLLACTYGVYMRTVLGLKMTQEFNALVPPMEQLVRRLLGTHHHREEVS